MTRAFWTCVKIGCGAAAIPLPPAVIGAYLALHPLPKECYADCQWRIPPEEWGPGGEFYRPPPGVPGLPPGGEEGAPPLGEGLPPLGFTPGLYASPGAPVFDVVSPHREAQHHPRHPEHEHHHHHHVPGGPPTEDVPEPAGVFGFALVALATVRVAWRKCRG